MAAPPTFAAVVRPLLSFDAKAAPFPVALSMSLLNLSCPFRARVPNILNISNVHQPFHWKVKRPFEHGLILYCPSCCDSAFRITACRYRVSICLLTGIEAVQHVGRMADCFRYFLIGWNIHFLRQRILKILVRHIKHPVQIVFPQRFFLRFLVVCLDDLPCKFAQAICADHTIQQRHWIGIPGKKKVNEF
uniref:Uncharacterized protein n=1 Tax=Myoviridae sp. ct25F5 TaxID=2826604 RepID=A0A8S5LTJ1_9CAUD|nr:MAG TPA: hypothetical protein [Myoviridae sp. ct25F5]